MVERWKNIELENKLFLNVDSQAVTQATTALENAIITEADGHTRFPGLKSFITFDQRGPVYMHDWQGDLIAVTSAGRVYRCKPDGTTIDVTGVPVDVRHRVIFAKSENELIMAAGGPMIRLAAEKTEVHAPETGNTTHVAYLDGFVIYIEPESQRWYHSAAGLTREFDPLDVFVASAQPDNVTALQVTPYRELLFAGIDSIEQWEPLAQGDRPFARRWTTGEGLLLPYSLVTADNGNFGINKDMEVIRFSGQQSFPVSDDIQKVLEKIDDPSDAWGAQMHTEGQKFILFQFPHATNIYKTRGLTFAYEYRTERWYQLFDWDEDLGLPTRWPGWSYFLMPQWQRRFVGVDGGIAEISPETYTNLGRIQRMRYRSAAISKWGESAVRNVRARIVRGVSPNGADHPAEIWLRARKDNKRYTNWVKKSLGRSGENQMEVRFGPFGNAYTWQWEYMVTADCKVEIAQMEAYVEQLGR